MLETHQRHGEALFVLVQAGRDERPRLIQHYGIARNSAHEQRQLQRRQERRDQAGRDHRGALRHLLDQRRRDQREQLVRRRMRRERTTTPTAITARSSRSRSSTRCEISEPSASCLAFIALVIASSLRGCSCRSVSAADCGGGFMPDTSCRRSSPVHRAADRPGLRLASRSLSVGAARRRMDSVLAASRFGVQRRTRAVVRRMLAWAATSPSLPA